jgi:hypothetical protein
MASYLNSFIKTANGLNNLQTQNNFYNSRFSLDPKERELANNREFCNNKFNLLKLKYAFMSTILPMLLIFLMAYMQVGDLRVYGGLIAWTLIGAGSGIYYNAKYAFLGLKINNSKDITPENCGF